MLFDLRQLRAFEAVARHGGFSRASREIGLSQPTLSTHIRNLESSMGTRLFDRGSRGVNLTPAGAVLARYAGRILDLCEESLEAVLAHTGQIRGSIHIDASTVPGEYLLPRWLGHFHQRYPDVRVTLTVSDSAKVLDRVEGNEVALGVIGSAGEHPFLEWKLLCEDRLVLVGPPGFPDPEVALQLSRGDFTRVPLIRRETGSGTQTALEKELRRRGIDPESLSWTAVLGSTRAVIEGVLAGLGGAFVSRGTVSREIEDGTLVLLPTGDFLVHRNLYVITNSRRTLSPAAACFLEELLRAGPSLETFGERS